MERKGEGMGQRGERTDQRQDAETKTENITRRMIERNISWR